MKITRIRWGIALLLGSGVLSWAVSKFTGIDAIGTVAVSSVIAFIGGAVFMSGVPRVS